MARVASIWRTRLKAHRHWLPANDLYNGRGSLEAKRAAEVGNADHWIISAGLGLVRASEEVPAYDLTVSGTGANQIKSKIHHEEFRSASWWNELSKRRRPARTITWLVQANPAAVVVLALPSNYLSMISDDVDRLSNSDRKRIRILGLPKSAVPDGFQPLWLPYDQRLDGPASPIRGTRSDFPQRAARHFLETVWPTAKSRKLGSHIAAVETALADYPLPAVKKRKQLEDPELIQVISSLWERAEGKSSRMLRILRDEEQIACEQNRFKNLFRQVKQQLGAYK